jgi:MFS family permease
MMGQSIGPVLGGVITHMFGFRAIFWFLFVFGFVTLLLILFLLPETNRRIAGNGTVLLRGVNKPFIYNFTPQPNVLCQKAPNIRVKKRALFASLLGSILSPFCFLCEKDVFATLMFGAVVYAVWSMVTSSTTHLFQPRFNLTNLEVGLVFLPNGLGCVLGSWLTGRLMDRDYRRVEADYRTAKNVPVEESLDHKALSDFPFTHARLRSAGPIVLVFIAAVAGYGFAISSDLLLSIRGLGLAVPLVLQFLVAYTATAVFTQNSALVVDLYPGASASATAVNNLIRCSVGAAGVAAVQFLIDAVGPGYAFLALAGLTSLMSSLLVAVWVWSVQWRGERIKRLRDGAYAKRRSESGESAIDA